MRSSNSSNTLAQSFYLRVMIYGLLCLMVALGFGYFFVSHEVELKVSQVQHEFEQQQKLLDSQDWIFLLKQDPSALSSTLNTMVQALGLDALHIFTPAFSLRAHAGTDPVWEKLPANFQQPGVYWRNGQWGRMIVIKDGSEPLGSVWVAKQTPTLLTFWANYQDALIGGIAVLLVLVFIFGGLVAFFQVRSFQKLFSIHPKEDGALMPAWLESLRASNRFGHLKSVLMSLTEKLADQENRKIASIHQLEASFSGSRLVHFTWHLEDDKIVFAKNLKAFLGYLPNDGTLSLEELVLQIHTDDLEVFQNQLSEHLKQHTEFFEAQFRMMDAKADYVWILGRGQVIERNDQGQPKLMVGTLCDVTETKKHQDRLELIYDAFNNTTEAVLVTDSNLRIILGNRSFAQITDYSLDEVRGKPIECLYSNQHAASFYTNIRRTLELEQHWQGEVVQQKKDGTEYPTLLTISGMSNKKGVPVHFVVMFFDQTAQRLQKNELEFLVSYDPLTQLMNRDQFKKHIERTLHISIQAHESAALLIVGIDNFKLINDTFGHLVGDELLKQTAHRLRQVIPARSQLARLGGDEFGLFIESFEGMDSLQFLAQDILTELQKPFSIDEHEIVVSTCIGVGVYPDDGQDMATLLMNADTALIYAKRDERNSYQFFIPSMNQEAQERQKLEHDLRIAIESNALKLYYQPKVDIRTGQVVGAEALLRWQHPKEGFISPQKFIPIAEETGLIIPISEWVFRQACMQGQLWRQKGWEHFSISVNVSGIHFKKDDFAEFMQKILHETGLPAHFLDLEITEGTLVADIEHCLLILKVLKSMGMTLSIDDFGTGYSSLSYLRRFPVDTLKVDQSFVQNMMINTEDANITTAVIAMAKGLQLKTVAEGVETIEQLNALKKLECDYVQGFYFSKALPPEDFEAYYFAQNQKVQDAQA